ncbi:hypothetical protein [Helicobacter trogontum]|uniref:Uncharacterized protein n=1 Tax=Helicobacter trogontum TaxID=50960 RepID=A0A4U8SDQ3_9HELI|nr:hypothetical protein [Helicobacter trogontum]TLD84256.1 hypothetical protein LS81_001975 [Helicobacter trogontum]
MPIQSYNPSVFIQRIESVGENATKQIVVNTTDPLQVAHSINILGIDYLIVNIDAETKIVTLDKDRNANIDLAQTPTIEVRQNVPDQNIEINTPIPITDTERKEKLFALQADLYQRKLNKAQELLGTNYYGMRHALDSEIRSYLGTFNDIHTPILKVLSRSSGESVEVVSTKLKKSIVEFEKAKQILETNFINLAIKVTQAQSKQELDAISLA